MSRANSSSSRLAVALISLLACLSFRSAAQTAPAESAPVNDCKGAGLQALRPCLHRLVDSGAVIGIVTLVDRRGQVQLDAAGQYRPDTIFQIMSMSKSFISAGVLRLVEEGKIPSVDVKVSSLPEFRDFPYPEVTIRGLLMHTAGIWSKRRLGPGVSVGTEPLLTNKLDKAPEVTVRDKTLDFVARRYADPKLYPLEGQGSYHYSNIGYDFLGWIIERVSKKPLPVFMRQELFAPLGMTDTFYFPDQATPQQRARIADVDRRYPDPSDYSHYDKTRPGWVYASPAGGMYSTAADLRRFMSLFRDGGRLPNGRRILSPSSIKLLMQDQAPNVDFGCKGRTGRTLGFFVVRTPGCPSAPAFDPGTITNTGRFLTMFWYNPQRDEIGIVLYQVVSNPDRPWDNRLPNPLRSIQKILSTKDTQGGPEASATPGKSNH